MINLTLSGVSIIYDNRVILKDFSYQFANGTYAIIGRNGTGKTSLLKEINASKIIENKKINASGRIELIMNDFALVKDSINLFDYYKVLFEDFENQEKMLEDVIEISKKFKWPIEMFHKSFSLLSGGERKIANLLCAIILSPKVLLLDEPEAQIDKENLPIFISLIKELSKNITVIFATHTKDFLEIVDREIFMIADGEINVIDKKHALDRVAGIPDKNERIVFDEKFKFPDRSKKFRC